MRQSLALRAYLARCAPQDMSCRTTSLKARWHVSSANLTWGLRKVSSARQEEEEAGSWDLIRRTGCHQAPQCLMYCGQLLILPSGGPPHEKTLGRGGWARSALTFATRNRRWRDKFTEHLETIQRPLDARNLAVRRPRLRAAGELFKQLDIVRGEPTSQGVDDGMEPDGADAVGKRSRVPQQTSWHFAQAEEF